MSAAPAKTRKALSLASSLADQKLDAQQFAKPIGKREHLYRRYGFLRAQRAPWEQRWRDIDELLLPCSSRFYALDRNRNMGVWQSILDNSGTMALDRLVAGLMSYGTSPARPWLRYRVADPDLNEYAPVAQWLDYAAQRTLEVFDISNTYPALSQMYEQLGAYGTTVSLVEPHTRKDAEESGEPHQVIRHCLVPIGEFVLATDYYGAVKSLYREFSKTAAEMVAEFGYEACSVAVRAAYNRGDLDNPFTIIHAIEPRKDRDPSSKTAQNMRWRSVYFELGSEADQLLSEGGFDEFPVLAPRWKVRPGETYGESPAMRALGDIGMLQQVQRTKLDLLNQNADPALLVPTTLATRQIERMPGGTTPYDQTSPHGGVKRLFDIELDWQGPKVEQEDIRSRIDKAFYSDILVMLSMVSDTTQRTAAEIAVRDEEKKSMLSPVSRQLNRELREPLVNLTFRQLIEQGQLPPAPRELHGMDLGVEYLDIFSQAQKQIGVNSTERWFNFLVMVAQGGRPEIMDKVDVDKMCDDTADRYSVSPKFVIATNDKRVKNIRDARNKAQAAQAQIQAQAIQAKTAKDAASAAATAPRPSAGSTPFDDLSGYGGAQGT